MAKRKMTPLAQALVLVDSLSPEETTTLLDYLRGKQPKATRSPKSQSVASAKSKSLLKRLEAQSAAITEGATGSATAASTGKCAEPNCGLPEWAPIHNPEVSGVNYHVFHATIKTKAASGD